MSNNFKLGSADWNLWPMSMEYEEIFPVFKKSGIQNLLQRMVPEVKDVVSEAL